MGFLYILKIHDCSKIYSKIGSTKFPINRLQSYKTGYVGKVKIKFDKLYFIPDNNCYEVDEKLKNDINRGFIRICESEEYCNSGTEIYDLISHEQLELWFVLNNIKFEIFDIENCKRENYKDYQKENEIKHKLVLEENNKINLRGYQNEVYNRLKKHLENNLKGVLEIFCGGGKTIIYQKYIQEFYKSYSIVIIVVPTLNLMGDMVQRWEDILGYLNLKSIQIGSNVNGTTNENIIKKFIKNNSKGFIFSTYASIDRLVNNITNINDGLLIFDECHKCCESSNIKNNVMYKINRIPNIKTHIKNIISATATPKYFTGNEKIGMNNSKYFGEFICNIPMIRLIREQFLCPYKIIISNVSSNLNGNINYYNTSINILIRYLSDGNKLNKILLYTNTVRTIELLYNVVKNTKFIIDNDIEVFKAHSGMKYYDVDKAKINFIKIKKTAIMINCRLFTEGINIPELDAVVFCDPKISPSDIIQCTGRVMRYNKNQPDKIAKIFIPISDLKDCGNKFNKMINIINVISTQDPKIRDEMLGFSKKNNKKNDENRGSSSIIELNITQEDYKILESKIKPVIINNMSDAIMYLLRDSVQRTPDKILQEILDREIYKSDNETTLNTCIKLCKTLNKEHKIKRNNDKYFILQKPKKLSTDDFIKSLQDADIETEQEYHNLYNGYYDNDYPINPCNIYNGFQWKSLIKEDNYFNIEDCIKRVKEVEPIFYIINKGITDLDKNKTLHDIDKKIPKDMFKVYGKKLYLINNNIFKEID